MTIMTDTDHTLVVTATGVQTLTDIGAHAGAVDRVWSRLNPELARKCVTSAARETTQLFSKFFGGETRISRDGELSLFVSTGSGFVFGMIFHPDHYQVPEPVVGDIDMAYGSKRVGRYCMAQVGGGYCATPYTFDYQLNASVPTCNALPMGHVAVPTTLPIPGTWSFHS